MGRGAASAGKEHFLPDVQDRWAVSRNRTLQRHPTLPTAFNFAGRNEQSAASKSA